MGTSRDNFSAAVVRALQDRVGSVCSRPGCGRATIGPSAHSGDKTVSVGRACHIKAAATGGPRYDPTQGDDLRKSIENGIWLCAICSDLIDKNDGADASVATLISWKLQAERKARTRLEGDVQPGPEWADKFSFVTYVNLPRLAQIAALRGMAVSMPSLPEGKYLFKLDYLGGAQAILAAERVIARLVLQAVPIAEIAALTTDSSGIVVAFDGQFFTKNGISWEDRVPSLPSEWEKAPHIWCKLGKRKVILPYDPRWITTSTALVSFRSGKRRFAGIAVVKEGAPTETVLLASPILIGIPKTDFERAMEG